MLRASVRPGAKVRGLGRPTRDLYLEGGFAECPDLELGAKAICYFMCLFSLFVLKFMFI